eukprot:COSAG05_NODE_4672_length_1415_cov_2.345745_1_plen_64_part_00
MTEGLLHHVYETFGPSSQRRFSYCARRCGGGIERANQRVLELGAVDLRWGELNRCGPAKFLRR